ncbi:MAG: AhpC/TSA family protein [Bacteroidales bacterium]|nr:AhpC/TSA family protein [Bacteroidales bacterium]
MRKVFYSFSVFFVALVFLSSCENQKKSGYTIDINFTNLKPDTEIVLQKRDNGSWVKLDSATLKEGKGTLSGEVKSPELLYLTLNKFNVYIPIWVENSTITVEAGLNSLTHPKITGSKVQDEYYAFMDSTQQFSNREKALGEAYRDARTKNDMAKMKDIENDFDSLQGLKMNYLLGYAERHNKSVISPYIVMSNSYALTLPQLEKATNSFDSTLAQNQYVQYLKNRVATLQRSAIGQPYIDFTLNDPEGKPVSLESVVKKNKYTLVDFWASWCMPCRAENPNVVKAYNTFHKKGFTVFGVSLDKNHQSWVDAIKKDGLVWTQVSDLQFWNSAAGKLYGVQSIPHNVLIGPDGTIVAKNLRGDELQSTLKKLLK